MVTIMIPNHVDLSISIRNSYRQTHGLETVDRQGQNGTEHEHMEIDRYIGLYHGSSRSR